MKSALRLSFLLLMLCGVLAAQGTNVPTCNSFDLSGRPIYSTALPPDTNGTTSCTDYFGVGNWANSPLPAGTITGFTLINGGSGYGNPMVVITDPTGTGATATATFDSTGAITGLTGNGTNYTMPMVSIVDVGVGGTLAAPLCSGAGQPTCGSGAMATAIIGPPFIAGTGMLKFQDPLPDLRQSGGQVDRSRGLADAALLVGDAEDLGPHLLIASLMPKPTRNVPASFSRTRPMTGLARMRAAR